MNWTWLYFAGPLLYLAIGGLVARDALDPKMLDSPKVEAALRSAPVSPGVIVALTWLAMLLFWPIVIAQDVLGWLHRRSHK